MLRLSCCVITIADPVSLKLRELGDGSPPKLVPHQNFHHPLASLQSTNLNKNLLIEDFCKQKRKNLQIKVEIFF